MKLLSAYETGTKQMAFPPEIRELVPGMIRWRQDFHRFPELGYQEHRTARRVADLLHSFGIQEIHEGIGRTGVVGVIRNGEGNSVGLRADMDALPITETGDVQYRSTSEGVMHACGHDGHTSMLLGAAKYLATTRRFTGNVVLIFQPAEEGMAGAKAMIDDGILQRFPIDSVFGLHNMPGMPAGEIAISSGAVMAAVDTFQIKVAGRGGHSAMPDQTRDPIVAAASLVLGLQTIVSRISDPRNPTVVSVTRIIAGEADNAIPDTATLRGSVRTLDPEGSKALRRNIERIANGIALTHNVEVSVEYTIGRSPTINSEREAILARNVALSLKPDVSVAPKQVPLMASEDFSYFLNERPGAYAFLGSGETHPALHSTNYDFNDDILIAGAAFLGRLAEGALTR